MLENLLNYRAVAADHGARRSWFVLPSCYRSYYEVSALIFSPDEITLASAGRANHISLAASSWRGIGSSKSSCSKIGTIC